MGRPKKLPKLRIVRRKYYCADIYSPDGKRTTVGFGTTDEHSQGEVFVAFGKWLDLYRDQPHKVLSYDSPYEAISQILNPTQDVTVGELLDKFHIYVSKKFKTEKDSEQHPDVAFITRVKDFLKPYRDWPVQTFGPDELYEVQQALVSHCYQRGKKTKRYTRRGINDTINWVHRIWKWGMGRHFVSAENVQGLEEVKSLRMGQTEASDNHKRGRITKEEFDKVINCLGDVVGDMLTLVWYTGMRPNEVCDMRPFDILHDDPECWLYIPGRDRSPVGKHKTTRFERVKVIPLTSECQKILLRRVKDFDAKKYIFSPVASMEEFLARKAAERKTPLEYGNRPGSNRKDHPMITPGEKYNHHGLRRACQRACARAGVEEFSPYDLRRTMATGTREVLGKEAAKVLLGHAKTDTTEIYLLDEVQEAMKVAKMLASTNRAS